MARRKSISFGESLRRAIRTKGTSGAALAEELGVSRQFVSQLVTSTRKPSAEMVGKIARALVVDPSSLQPRLDLATKTVATTEFDYDVFIIWAGDSARAKRIHRVLETSGFRTFFSEKAIPPGEPYPEELAAAVQASRRLLLLWSKEASESEWVQHEINNFIVSNGGLQERPVFISVSEDAPEIPGMLAGISRCDDDLDIVAQFSGEHTKELADRINSAEAELRVARASIRENLGPYVLSRFWQDFARDGVVHISTSARHIGPKGGRGTGGRSNIDIWDYKTTLDFTRFLSKDYPSVRVVVDDPIPKIETTDSIKDRILLIEQLIRGKSYIIIGSPDVSDLSEVVFARLHNIKPYMGELEKDRGYVIVKREKAARIPSSVYRPQQSDDAIEGIARITDKTRMFECIEEPPAGETYGILAMVNDLDGGTAMILSGFTGIATNGIAKLLTDTIHHKELNRLLEDQMKGASHRSIRGFEALIRVRYEMEWPDEEDIAREGDTRRLLYSESAVEYVELVTI